MAIPKITYLGHAGFMIETDHELILMDPWLSDIGAYAMSWFQYPYNHYLADIVRRKVEETDKAVIVYISHEHQDHFDETFLRSLPERKVMLMLPDFTRDFFYKKFVSWEGGQYFFEDNSRFALRDGYLEFYIHDSIREADSAVLFHNKGFNFLNINDCHIHDRVAEIKERNGHINVLTGSFSGASWFPTCYDYDDETYAKKAKRNKYARFSALCKLIENIQPGYYVPSAGPPCFLDINLFELNFQKDNIFPHVYELYEFWKQWKGDLSHTLFDYRYARDILCHTNLRIPPDKTEYQLREELTSYRDIIFKKHSQLPGANWDKVKQALKLELQQKLDSFSLACKINKVLFVTQPGLSSYGIIVDFANGEVREDFIDWTMPLPKNCYVITASATSWNTLEACGGKLTWYEWLLSFRFRVVRNPDEFDPLLDGFLVNEAEDLKAFCKHYEARQSDETILVHTDSKIYKVHRRCPHAGADLSKGWIDGNHLVCAKHHWRFDLENGGKCDIHDSTINAVEVVE